MSLYCCLLWKLLHKEQKQSSSPRTAGRESLMSPSRAALAGRRSMSIRHFGSLHDIGIASRVSIEPANKQTAAESLLPVARLAYIKQNVGVGRKESLDDAQNRRTEFQIER